MSFILESIKQAERERKLGQQKAPEISIEYEGAHIDNIENNKMRWVLFLIGLTVTAIFVWGAAYYLTNKDRQYIEQLSVNKMSSDMNVGAEPNVQVQVQAQPIPIAQNDMAQQSFAMVSNKKLHKSDLKSVKLITEEGEVPVPSVVSESMQTKQPVKNEVAHKSNSVAELEKVSGEELAKEKQFQVATARLEGTSNKQALANIYANFAALDNEGPIVDDLKPLLEQVDEQQIQIKIASYVIPEANASKNMKKEIDKLSNDSNYNLQHEQAVSSGVPSFGELPYDIQERIPNFNVSVHMFHADPMQRRIRINGQMYTEGKSLQQDLALIEITRYGAVFDYQGNLFRFNVR